MGRFLEYCASYYCILSGLALVAERKNHSELQPFSGSRALALNVLLIPSAYGTFILPLAAVYFLGWGVALFGPLVALIMALFTPKDITWQASFAFPVLFFLAGWLLAIHSFAA